MQLRITLPLLCAVVPACLDGKPDDYDFGGADDKSDSYADRIGLRGQVRFGVTTPDQQLEANFRIIGWDFTLPASARVAISTVAPSRGDGIDSVIYLYRQSASGWGRYLVRDDDGGEDDYSRIERSLTAGTYRLVVKAHARDDLGGYRIAAECLSGQCEPTPAESCEAFAEWSEGVCGAAASTAEWQACLGGEQARALACCVEDGEANGEGTGSQAWCGPIGGDLSLTATSRARPSTLRWLGGIAQLGGIAPGAVPSHDQVTRALYLVHELFGNECDALPLGPGLSYDTYDSAAAYFAAARAIDTTGWEDAPSATNLGRLEEVTAAGGTWRAYVGGSLSEACAGSGTAAWHLVWDLTRQHVYYAQWVEYAE